MKMLYLKQFLNVSCIFKIVEKFIHKHSFSLDLFFISEKSTQPEKSKIMSLPL